MPAHDCAFALSIAFAEPLPVGGAGGKRSRFTAARAIFFGLLVGLDVGVGWDRKRIKTLKRAERGVSWSVLERFSPMGRKR
jgi:hypothetical protein